MENLRELYQEVLLEHARHPRNFGIEDESNAQCANGFNPLCGDRLRLCIYCENNVIQKICFTGNGCAISMASASLLTEQLHNKTVEEAEILFKYFHAMLVSKEDPNHALGKLTVFQGVQEFPSRIKCATLAWHALKAALDGQQ